MVIQWYSRSLSVSAYIWRWITSLIFRGEALSKWRVHTNERSFAGTISMASVVPRQAICQRLLRGEQGSHRAQFPLDSSDLRTALSIGEHQQGRWINREVFAYGGHKMVREKGSKVPGNLLKQWHLRQKSQEAKREIPHQRKRHRQPQHLGCWQFNRFLPMASRTMGLCFVMCLVLIPKALTFDAMFVVPVDLVIDSFRGGWEEIASQAALVTHFLRACDSVNINN